MTTTPRVASDTSRQDGAVVVEFAIIFTLFMMVLWGILSYGMLFAVQQTITHASAEAARASISLDGADAEARATEIVEEQMSWLGGFSDGLSVIAEAVPCAHDVTLECLSVGVTYNWRDYPVIPPILDVLTPRTIGSVSTVQLDS